MIRRTVQLGYQENLDAREIESDWMMSGAKIEAGKNGWCHPIWRKAGCAPWFCFEERGIPMLKDDKTGFKQIPALSMVKTLIYGKIHEILPMFILRRKRQSGKASFI
jgi:hypothetical protein